MTDAAEMTEMERLRPTALHLQADARGGVDDASEDSDDELLSQRIHGFPNRPLPIKFEPELTFANFFQVLGARLQRFFGIDEKQEEREIWRIRHNLALEKFLKEESIHRTSPVDMTDGEEAPPVPEKKPDVWEMVWTWFQRRVLSVGEDMVDARRTFHVERISRESLGGRVHDHYKRRPLFIYWASFVQILVMIITLSAYDFAPVGVGVQNRSSAVASVGGGLETTYYEVDLNLWLGPKFADLIHLGAMYGPCMRRDRKLWKRIEQEREAERDSTACCVRKDAQFCYQSLQRDCVAGFFDWTKWNGTASIKGTSFQTANITFETPNVTLREYNCLQRTDGLYNCYRFSGSVCGVDPRTCAQPASEFPHDWPDDISKWPVCRRPETVIDPDFINSICEVTGRPCCIGNQGVCTIVTKEHCDFVKGYYHDDKRLCSEVNCLERACGLTGFLQRDYPDHFYRLWTALCLHVGILHLALTLFVQFTVGRHIEKVIGWTRMAMIYILSGIGGNLLSVVFVPYHAEVGPGASLCGLLAVITTDLYREGDIFKSLRKYRALIVVFLLFLLFLGLLPFVDNFAHIGGFFVGYLSSSLFIPYFGQPLTKPTSKLTESEIKSMRKKNVIRVAISFIALLLYYIILALVFWVAQPTCDSCYYFNCIPLKRNYCKGLSNDLQARNCYVC